MSSAPSPTAVLTPVAAPSCAVCPHALAEHDRISLRFCEASRVQLAGSAAPRGCVCPT